MEKKILPYIIVFSALSVSASAIFYSVTGLGQIFAGASLEVKIMATALEIAKLVAAAFLYNYWKEINIVIKSYLMIAVFVLMCITSGGIYGYLSAAYAETKNKVELMDKDFEVMDARRDRFNDKLISYQTEKENLNNNISELTKALSNNVIQYKDKETGQLITTTSSSNRKIYTEQLEKSEARRDVLSENITAMTDSITSIDIAKIEIERGSDIAGEIGPLKYIAELTGKSMDTVVNWFIIALMGVFDPLAVALVISANIVFASRRKLQDKEDLAKTVDDKIKLFEEREKEFKTLEENFNNRLHDIEEKERIIKEKEDIFNKSLIDKENNLNSKLSLREKSVQEELNKKLEELDNEIKSRRDNILKIEEDIKTSNEEVSEDLKKEKSRIQNIEYQLTEDRAKLKEEKDKFKNRIDGLDLETTKINSERENIEKEKSEISSEKEKLKLQKESLDKMNKEIEEWKRINWRLRKQNND
jgi:chromosome segregation ATPase